ncbi:hypothetical protein [Salinibacter ruber]|uniref:hypothetical protein n=1 Tax=Salinibacter ruber TaxID=146919 RepID=UPI003C6E150B
MEVSFTARTHPETNGKNERLGGTLQAKVLRPEHFAGLQACQERFKDWRRLRAASVSTRPSAWKCQPAATRSPTGSILKNLRQSSMGPATRYAR